MPFWRILVLIITVFTVYFLYKYSTQLPNVGANNLPKMADMTIYHDVTGEGTSNQDQHDGAGEATSNQGQHSETGSVTSNQNQRSGKGYMFTLFFRDQITVAFANLMSLACFSSKIGNIRVVEPFVFGSRLGLNVNASLTNATRLTDLFDIRGAHELAKKKHFNFDVASFDDFLKDAPRKLLIVDHIGGECGHQNNGRIFAEQNGFELVGSICLHYDRSGKTPLREIEKQIYHKYSKAEVTVMFNYFGGLESGKFNPATVHRLYITLPRECYRRDSRIYSVMKPSPLVTQCADRYIQTYMQHEKYLSVMIRLERILPPGTKGMKQIECAKKCLRSFILRLMVIKKQYGVNYVFMCLDVGKYGSDIMANGVSALRPVYDSFLLQTIGFTLSEYDSTFTNITTRDNPGFVSMVQKTIAAKGEVLVLVGKGSNFHTSARALYGQLSKKNNVVQIDNSCE